MSERLPPVAGEWIDRSQILPFTFEGSAYWGYAGDTITSALWAANVRSLGRSFKYHRPRGILSLANHDVNTLMQAGSQLNLRADVTPLAAGLNLTAVHTFGGVAGDRASLLDACSAFLPVGFYYKAFHQKRLFPLWERLIRRLTGLGRVDPTTPRRHPPNRYDTCDVLVVGAGLAGLQAALTAATAGADVVLVDENARAGGSAGYQRELDPAVLQTLITAVTDHPRIRLWLETEAAGYYADHWLPLVQRDRLIKLRANAVIVASGAYEQPAVFRNNDLPGVMLASAAQRLIYRYGVQPMRRAVVLVANADGYRAAQDLLQHGVQVQAIVDLRGAIAPPDLPPSVPILRGHCIYEACSTPARDGVAAVGVCRLDAQGNPQLASRQRFECDGVVMSVGWTAAANLLYQAGAQMRFDSALQQFVPARLPPGVFACGRVNGCYGPQRQADGNRAGAAAAAYLGFGPKPTQGDRPPAPPSPPSHPWPIVAHPQGKNFVDFDEDLQLKDFYNAIQEGFDNIELLKRYTTVGMGPSQGKHANMNALRILAAATGQSPEVVGTTTSRPFVHPVPLAILAGRSCIPERRTSLHDCHLQHGAAWLPVGPWQRPQYYPTAGLSQAECVAQEVLAVRQGVGLIDVSTLGKLEVRGPDAAEFLERVYTGRFASLKPGRSRYALMLDETGTLIDDGVVARLAIDHFYCTTTTTGAIAVYRELLRLNTLWQLDCSLINLTGAHAALNLAGVHARAVLSRLCSLDLSTAHFPYLAAQPATVAEIPVLLLRVGFVGEWGYEIHVAAELAPALWEVLLTAGQPFGLRPFGVEAQRVLRLEKGHLILGQDTDGLTTPVEANLDWAVKLDKPFFVGQRSLQIRRASARHTLVGFTLDPAFAATPPQESHLAIARHQIVGRITSIAFSPTLQQWIGLATVNPELATPGTPLHFRRSDGTLVAATVRPLPFYDPQQLRQQDPAAPLPQRSS